MQTKNKTMNQNQNENLLELQNPPVLSDDEKAFNHLCQFSQAIDHKELKKELWEQLFYTLTADNTFMNGNQRAAHMMNYKLMMATSKAIRQLFPQNDKPKVLIEK